jgi:Dna[CI] antecedent, DciA
MNPIQNLLNSTVVAPEVLKASRAISVMRKWELVVGKDMANRSWPERFDHGTVWVAVTGSAWAQELRMQKDEIISRLNTIADEPGLFVNARFGVRPLKREIEGEPEEIEVADTEGLTIREIAEKRLQAWRDASGTES